MVYDLIQGGCMIYVPTGQSTIGEYPKGQSVTANTPQDKASINN